MQVAPNCLLLKTPSIRAPKWFLPWSSPSRRRKVKGSKTPQLPPKLTLELSLGNSATRCHQVVLPSDIDASKLPPAAFEFGRVVRGQGDH